MYSDHLLYLDQLMRVRGRSAEPWFPGWSVYRSAASWQRPSFYFLPFFPCLVICSGFNSVVDKARITKLGILVHLYILFLGCVCACMQSCRFKFTFTLDIRVLLPKKTNTYWITMDNTRETLSVWTSHIKVDLNEHLDQLPSCLIYCYHRAAVAMIKYHQRYAASGNKQMSYQSDQTQCIWGGIDQPGMLDMPGISWTLEEHSEDQRHRKSRHRVVHWDEEEEEGGGEEEDKGQWFVTVQVRMWTSHPRSLLRHHRGQTVGLLLH